MARIRRVAVPVFLSPNQLFERIRRRHPNAFLLESREGPRRLARYSIIGFGPKEFFHDRKGADPLEAVQEVLAQHEAPSGEGFTGGLVGAIAYDAVAHMDSVGHRKNPPHFLLGLYTDAVVYNHHKGSVAYVTQDEDRSDEVLEAANASEPQRRRLRIGAVRSNRSKPDFCQAVRSAQRRIRDGEAYQVVLSRRFDATYQGDPDALYERIRARNPSPYLYFLDFGDHKVVGSSPEMLVRVEDRVVETFPIAGTRPVGADRASDQRLQRELRNDPKENAEHLMLVDLARNDVGRVAETGSVRVPQYAKVESYSSVHHLVSRVVGRLRKDRTSLDAFASVFPAGTVSGAPKVRAMQIIDELEPEPRGLYAGAVGYFGFNGDLDAAITIRTLLADDDGNLSVQAGAGIVYDSVPEREYAETRHKADSILKFLGDEA